ncbi:hypothetical protein HT665_00260 [Ursidibacter maritimus]|uniref:Uncharacterized protein n=1 Tax=Ursidibacter maritimus TaxID=1331689 RepID=A0A949WML7_9PAST|nr:hypothetical protein [Ursidibacter maritimus]MBV6523597.1 hypothetical protein [Ursidibacter maritimus]MBV6525097.1 hypothetical protein [Ursidibacter maritimus]MBV6527299.1 hypothetical protein [Ursidibacter maritimus]MBV6528711.1 hypothetical protein [Ursidibacter maritimus]MBV6530666.1 hypothetical protein [Ursidibacter maritimus]
MQKLLFIISTVHYCLVLLNYQLAERLEIATLVELADWMIEADKILNFNENIK